MAVNHLIQRSTNFLRAKSERKGLGSATPHSRTFGLLCLLAAVWAGGLAEAVSAPSPSFYVSEYRVNGAKSLTKVQVEEAVYPFLGPGRTTDDVEKARAALELAYREKGYQAATVQIPDQKMRRGVVILQVSEGEVGRLRIRGSRYFSLAQIKEEAPSLAEGKVLNFNEVSKDLVTLNRNGDRRITPSLRAGKEPGTVDVDLNVEDSPPLHGSVEINNRKSADTTELRLNGSASYNNLWQMGHTVGASFQTSPLDFSEVKVFSGYYLAPVPGINGLSLMAQGTSQASNVSTLGGLAVAGKGEVIGLRAILNLPPAKDYYHSLTLGGDYKHFDQNLTVGGVQLTSPIRYFPFSILYSGTKTGKGGVTEINAGPTFHVRGLGSDPDTFGAKRFKAQGSFVYFRGDIAHTQDLPAGVQIYGKGQGQVSGQPLLDSEQFSGGGLETVRGYLESETLGDNAVFGTVELRSPSLTSLLGKKVDDWRFYVFADGGVLTLNEPLPQQQSSFQLASYGVGSRLRMYEHFNGSLDVSRPVIEQTQTDDGDTVLTFRVWADF